VRLAIADPPYLGRAHRWYGIGGRGDFKGNGTADEHPAAAEWDDPARHVALVDQLRTEFDGWAIACTPSSLATYLPACPVDVRILAWQRLNAPPSGSRIRGTWEPVIVAIPPGRSGRGGGLIRNDVLTAAAPRRGFAGEKPEAWTHWVLDVLGYVPELDQLVDLFPGSGAVTVAAGVML
jgi:hypothetical protein